jgi:hypothetical protein
MIMIAIIVNVLPFIDEDLEKGEGRPEIGPVVSARC